jgi:hypothetical protein
MRHDASKERAARAKTSQSAPRSGLQPLQGRLEIGEPDRSFVPVADPDLIFVAPYVAELEGTITPEATVNKRVGVRRDAGSNYATTC